MMASNEFEPVPEISCLIAFLGFAACGVTSGFSRAPNARVILKSGVCHECDVAQFNESRRRDALYRPQQNASRSATEAGITQGPHRSLRDADRSHLGSAMERRR